MFSFYQTNLAFCCEKIYFQASSIGSLIGICVLSEELFVSETLHATHNRSLWRIKNKKFERIK